jgi:hypothetical protein
MKTKSQVDLVLDIRRAPGIARDGGVFFVDVAADEFAVRWHGEGDPGGTVSHEDAYFDGPARAE